ncbi:hypothetical protein M406DRAFT_74202 [Cryphonectria parasitica EP155]|uniref:DUF1917-domain-containing protein n=1 Tax=Cryphonectria parasitica (strain ATCC 38755 / EP155) TaxID=660469 RepID=A0A9P4XZH0_CRYP1|nr:uncharacterized protein M406DRAFT_74202 [Cryphonectria parasitica EP155]KAF3763617.1 hypothetical protein M406DRAFT_74202 [Cryphonectria parasitica EP155]
MDSDSDFYGDKDEVQDLEARLSSFSPANYWQSRSITKTASPAATITTTTTTTTTKTTKMKQEPSSPPPLAPATTSSSLHNPYEGRTACAKQLSETTQSFLDRLPPSTTDAVPGILPWIYVANPYIPRADRGGEEAPEEFGAEVGRFVEGGGARLEMFGDLLREVEEKAGGGGQGQGLSGGGGGGGGFFGGPSRAVVNREVAKQREACVNDLLMLANVLRVRTGKWMLFIDPAYVDSVWATVVQATVRNELGIAAKVAPREHRGSTRSRLICIYTYDFGDRDDVARVLNRMRQLELVRTGPRRQQVYYKTALPVTDSRFILVLIRIDAWTYLGIGADNPWGLRASLYSSNDIFTYIKEKDGTVLDRMVKREKGPAALEKVIKEEEEFDGGGWTF